MLTNKYICFYVHLNDPPSIDAGRLMPVSLMPITFMQVTIDAQEAFLMPVTIDAGHY